MLAANPRIKCVISPFDFGILTHSSVLCPNRIQFIFRKNIGRALPTRPEKISQPFHTRHTTPIPSSVETGVAFVLRPLSEELLEVEVEVEVEAEVVIIAVQVSQVDYGW